MNQAHINLSIILLIIPCLSAYGEDVSTSTITVQVSTTTSTLNKLKPNDKNILWVFPNHSTEENPGEWKPMSSRDKLSLAIDDSLDPYAIPAIAVYASIDHWQNKIPVFGKSWSGFGKRYALEVANQTVDNFTSEALFPILLHEDPRYFRLGKGGFWHRTGYALSRAFIVKNDKGYNEFNYAGLGGHLVSAGLQNTYVSPAERNLGYSGATVGIDIGLDMFFNEAKEFWPDIRHWLGGR
jgi:hypothetical protein